jgi:hypothetical protein
MQYIFVALDVEEMCVYEMAQYKYINRTDSFNWVNKQDSILTQVTHFCIPDPIPSEE